MKFRIIKEGKFRIIKEGNKYKIQKKWIFFWNILYEDSVGNDGSGYYEALTFNSVEAAKKYIERITSVREF